MNSTFVFLHVGEDPNIEYFVRSILLTSPDAEIIQCSDLTTQKVKGVSTIFRNNEDNTNLMTFRLSCFHKLKLEHPAIYLDTDMLICKKINATELLKNFDVLCCQRSFGCDALINTTFKGMDLSEYNNKTFGEIYPIIACFTISRSYRYWLECFNNLLEINPKFHSWYGDQEAMRNISTTNKFLIGYLPESDVGCLPEFVKKNKLPTVLHFKGVARKSYLKPIFDELISENLI